MHEPVGRLLMPDEAQADHRGDFLGQIVQHEDIPEPHLLVEGVPHDNRFLNPLRVGACRRGAPSGTGVWRIADHAACSASTTHPLLVNRSGVPASASSIRSAQYAYASGRLEVLPADAHVELGREDPVPERVRPDDARLSRPPVGVG